MKFLNIRKIDEFGNDIKMKQRIEEPKKELIIKKRIKALYNKLKIIYDTKTDLMKISSFYRYSSTYPVGSWIDYFSFKLATTFGERFLLVGNEILFYLDKALPSTSFDFVEPYDFIFKIEFVGIDGKFVKITPEPMIKFAPKEIDLAILEFENAIEPIYQKALKRESTHKTCIEYFSKME